MENICARQREAKENLCLRLMSSENQSSPLYPGRLKAAVFHNTAWSNFKIRQRHVPVMHDSDI